MNDSFHSIGIQINAQSNRLMHYLGRILKERHGTKLHLYVRNDIEQRGLARDDTDGLWDSIEISHRLIPALDDPIDDENAVIATSQAYERMIGETISKLTLEHRQFGRGFSPGGVQYPRSPIIERASYVQMLHAFNDTLAFWEKEIDEKGLTLVLNAEKWVAAMCRAKGIQYRKLGLGRHGNFQYWSPDEYFRNPLLQPTYEQLTSWPDAALSGTYASQVSKNKKALEVASLKGIAQSLAINVLRLGVNRIRGLQVDRPRLTDVVRSTVRPFQQMREYRQLATTTLDDLESKKFLYFPLHKEPEVDFLIRTPDYLSQQAAIMAISRDLPAGVVLAIKEHIPATGPRPPGFYRQLIDLKNVVLVDIFESSIELIRHASATVTFLGSAGIEATILGRPVIQFSPHTHNHFVPHVMTLASERELKSCIDRVLDEQIDLDQARDDGARFLEAIKQSCFDLGEYLKTRGGDFGATLETAETLYEGLRESIELNSAQAAEVRASTR